MGFVWDSLATDLIPPPTSVVDAAFGPPADGPPQAPVQPALMPRPNEAPEVAAHTLTPQPHQIDSQG